MQSVNFNLADITAKVIMTPTVAIPGQTTEITDDITGVVHDDHIDPLTHIFFAMTLYITNHLPTEALQLTTEFTAYHALNQHVNPPGKAHTNHHHIHRHYKAKCIPKRIQELQYR